MSILLHPIEEHVELCVVLLFDAFDITCPVILGKGTQPTAQFLGQNAGAYATVQAIPFGRLVEGDLRRKNKNKLTSHSENQKLSLCR